MNGGGRLAEAESCHLRKPRAGILEARAQADILNWTVNSKSDWQPEMRPACRHPCRWLLGEHFHLLRCLRLE